MSTIKFAKQLVSDKENSNKYVIKTDLQEFGYAYIYHNSHINNIYFFVYPQYRSNGFGFLLFSHIIKELRNISEYTHIELDVDKQNTHANNIIAKSGGLLLAEDSQKHWVLKL